MKNRGGPALLKGRHMKAIVDETLCIGCGLCEEVCPAVFELVEGMAKVKVADVPRGEEDCCRQAEDDCPVDAIAIE